MGGMDPDEFRRNGHAVVDWIADYMERVGELEIMASVEPGEIAAMLPERAPEEPEAFDSLLADLDDVVLPGITHWQSPGWFAYFPANVSGPSILGELASAGLGVQGMLWSTSPAATEIELRVVDWLVHLLGLPPHFLHSQGPGGGSIQMSASDATHLVHVVARGRGDVAYTSEQAHSSVARGARIAGLQVRTIATDEHYAMRPDALREAIETDRAQGHTPAIVTSAIGTTGTGAVDPIEAISVIAREHGMWHHVDAAWAGSAMILPEQRIHQRGVEHVDSYTFNPHKWLFTNFDCNVLWWADRAPLLEVTSDTPPYLRDAASAMDLRDWQVPLGRRFRALKLWWVLRSYGARGLREAVGRHIELARDFARRVDDHPLLEHVAPPSFALVSFRHVDGNAATDALAAAINASGHSYVTPSSARRHALHPCVDRSEWTAAAHVDRLWETITRSAATPARP